MTDRPVATAEVPQHLEPSGRVVTPPDLPSELRDLVAAGAELFADAGLSLPLIEVVHHGDDRDPCRGRVGMHRPVDGGSVIELCTVDTTFATEVMILHELAHAWSEHALTPERRAAFQQLRGWTHWRDYESVPWHENGTEQAAEIIVWGVIDQPLRIVRIDQNDCDQLEAGYRTLTGSAPRHRFPDHC